MTWGKLFQPREFIQRVLDPAHPCPQYPRYSQVNFHLLHVAKILSLAHSFLNSIALGLQQGLLPVLSTGHQETVLFL